jgi:trehalose-phosphatase
MGKPLAQMTAEIEGSVRAADKIFLFLDFDGALAPVTPDYRDAELGGEAARTLKAFAKQDRTVTTILSGRDAGDLFGRIRVEGLIYAGNHGLEIFGRNMAFVERQAAARREELGHLCRELEGRMEFYPGAEVEYKGLSASVHYRQAASADLPLIGNIVRAAVEERGGRFHISHGREVFEILPRAGWNKGRAARLVRRKAGRGDGPLSIYAGDGVGGEEAFHALTDAITIKVGERAETRARYGLRGPAEVHEFLQWLSERLPGTVQ